MKRTSSLLWLIAFVFPVFLYSCTKDKTPETFAEEVMEAFEDDNATAFRQLYITKDEILQVIDQSKLPAEKKKEARARIRLKSAFWKNLSKVSFAAVRYEAYELGVDWSDITIEKINVQPTGMQLFDFNQLLVEENDIHLKDIDIEFLSAGGHYILHLDDCIETPNGWKLTEEVRVRRNVEFE